MPATLLQVAGVVPYPFIFKDRAIQDYYDELWRGVYEASDEQVDFWAAERTAGRIIRTNIEVLLYCYLVIKTGSEIRLERLFKEYKEWLQDKSSADRVTFLRELKDYAESYFAFPAGSELNGIKFCEDEKRFFHVVENLMVTTALPLVLYLYKTVEDEQERRKILLVLEGYLVRRNVTRLTTKNYNQLFVQMISRLESARQQEGAPSHAGFCDMLASYSEDTNRMPTDLEFADAFHCEALSNQNAREILFLVALKQAADVLADMPDMSLGNYSVEHLMPVKWEKNWAKPDMPPQDKENRNRALKTLGNLTLVTKRLNSKMQNSAWTEKKKILKRYSVLPMTVNYLENDLWDEDGITARANDLAAVALNIWRNPAG